MKNVEKNQLFGGEKQILLQKLPRAAFQETIKPPKAAQNSLTANMSK